MSLSRHTCQVNKSSMWLLIPSIISKHTLLHVNGLKSDRALVKVWHIAAKLSHQTNLAITKLSLSLIHNTIGLGLPMFINATTRQQISIYSIGPYWHLLACTPTFGKVGVETNFFLLAPLTNPDLYPHLKIRGAAAGWVTNKQNNFITVSLLKLHQNTVKFDCQNEKKTPISCGLHLPSLLLGLCHWRISLGDLLLAPPSRFS